VKVSVGQAKNDNQMWKKDPEQKLAYTGATKWARRWCPEILLGILIDDDEHPSMREATGHVVETAASARVITGGDTPAPTKEATPAKAEPAAKSGKGSKKQAPAQQTEPIPERTVMVEEIKAAFKLAGLISTAAMDVCRKAGLLAPDASFSDLNDNEMSVVFHRRLELFPPLPIIQAFYEGHKVSHSPADAERKWTRWNLVYQVAGEEGQQEASTFSATIGSVLDALEGGEALLLRVAPGEKGGSIVTLELAPNAGGAQ